MEFEELKERIKLHEGFVPKIYKDTLGFATIGFGHKVVHEDNFIEGKEYTKEELESTFEKDFIKFEIKKNKNNFLLSNEQKKSLEYITSIGNN